MNPTAVTVGALGVAAGVAHWGRSRASAKGPEVPHAAAPGWAREVQAAIVRRWPETPRSAVGSYAVAAASSQLAAWRATYGVTRLDGDDVPRVPLGKLSGLTDRWMRVVASVPTVDRPEEAFPVWGVGTWIDEQQGVSPQARAAIDAAAAWRELNRQAWAAATRTVGGGAAVDLLLVQRTIRRLAELAAALDLLLETTVAADFDQGYADYLGARWEQVSGAVVGAGGAVAGLAGQLTGAVVGALAKTFGVALFVGVVGYYVYRRTAPS